jgi:hypothetical protein
MLAIRPGPRTTSPWRIAHAAGEQLPGHTADDGEHGHYGEAAKIPSFGELPRRRIVRTWSRRRRLSQVAPPAAVRRSLYECSLVSSPSPRCLGPSERSLDQPVLK